MRTRAKASLAVCAPLLAAGFWAASPAHSAVTRIFSPDCEMTITDPIPVTADPVRLLAKITEPLGDSLSGTVDAKSNVQVVSVRKAQDNPLTVTITLNTMRAVRGEWQLSVRGEQGMCSAKIWVGKGGE